MVLKFKHDKRLTNSTAKVVDGKLVLSLPDAITPIVWQMDLAHAKASALEVREDKETGHFNLTLKTPKGETVEIANFESRAYAVEGLMAASFALENAQGQIRTHANEPALSDDNTTNTTLSGSNPQPKKSKWMGALLGLVILFILFTIWGAIVPTTVSTSTNTATQTSLPAGQNPATATGVPVSADDFLNGQ